MCNSRSYATREINGSYVRRWILDRWSDVALDRIRGADVEAWLDSAELQQLSNGTKAKIRNIMSAIYSHAKRQGWIKFNPISTVRQSARREHVPDVLMPAEALAIAKEIELRELVLAIFGIGNGPRVSESLALKWEDLDFAGKQMHIRRSIWHQQINERCKTANSRKTVPLHELQIGILLDWCRASPYNQPGDWVFASPQMQGKQPFWPERLRKNLQAVVKRLGINKRVGWHTFRHTLSTMLRANGGYQRPNRSVSRLGQGRSGALHAGNTRSQICGASSRTGDDFWKRLREWHIPVHGRFADH